VGDFFDQAEERSRCRNTRRRVAREAAHMHFVNDQIFARDRRGFHALPIERIRGDEPARHEVAAGAVVAREVCVEACAGHVSAQHAVRVPERPGQRTGVRIDQELAGIEPVAVARVERAFSMEPVLPTGTDAGYEAHENMVAAIRQGKYVGGLSGSRGKQGHMHTRGVLGVHRKPNASGYHLRTQFFGAARFNRKPRMQFTRKFGRIRVERDRGFGHRELCAGGAGVWIVHVS
jgi:hypothetical protein